MSLSVRKVASNCLGLKPPIAVREDLFGRLGDFSENLHLRGQLQTIVSHYCDFALPPKYIAHHPHLSLIPAIHFDHFNSSVTNLAAPKPGEVDVKLIRHGLVLGTCLNFLFDDRGNLYGFCGNLLGIGGRIAFNLTLFDENLEKIDEYEIVQFPSSDLLFGELPLNLGYFVMDNQGRVIVVKHDTDIVFLKKNDANKIEPVQVWHMQDQLKQELEEDIAEQTLAQVFPAGDRGYWIMALGDEENDIPAYLGKLSDSGKLEDIHVFRGESIANGMAVDQSGAYIVTDYALYRFSQPADGQLNIDWRKSLVAITDNADSRVNLLVFERQSGRSICKIPLFKEGKSANENTVLAYGDSIIAQNFYDAPPYNEDMWGLKPGLIRIDVRKDRSGGDVVWNNDEFASTATVRLSTKTGLIYATIQTTEDEDYAMAFIDFHTGRFVQKVSMGSGRAYRIAMSPAYFVPGGRLVQPVRRGIVVFQN
jgi:hypothetical protein